MELLVQCERANRGTYVGRRNTKVSGLSHSIFRRWLPTFCFPVLSSHWAASSLQSSGFCSILSAAAFLFLGGCEISIHCAWSIKAAGLCWGSSGFCYDSSSSWIQCSVGWSKSEQRWWSGSCSHVSAARRQKLLSSPCPGLSWLSHVSGSKSHFRAPQLAVPFCCPGTEISSWFLPKALLQKEKKPNHQLSMKEAAEKCTPVCQSAAELVVVEGPFWKKLMVRKWVFNLMIKCSTAVLCHSSKNTADAQNVSGSCLKAVEFAEMKGGKTDTNLSVSCTCLVYLFALLTINCFPNLCYLHP